jgi:hypothetical protein
MIFALFFTFFTMQYDVFHDIGKKPAALMVFSLIFTDSIYCMNSLQCFAVIFLLLTRFQALNKFSRKIIKSQNFEKDFRRSQALMFKLLSVSKLINRSFGFQFMLSIILLLLFGIFAVFTAFEAFVLQVEEFRKIALIIMYYNFYDVFMLIVICTFSTLIKREIENR